MLSFLKNGLLFAILFIGLPVSAQSDPLPDNLKISLEINNGGEFRTLNLHKTNARGEDFKILLFENEIYSELSPLPEARTFIGTTEENSNEIVFASIDGNGILRTKCFDHEVGHGYSWEKSIDVSDQIINPDTATSDLPSQPVGWPKSGNTSTPNIGLKIPTNISPTGVAYGEFVNLNLGIDITSATYNAYKGNIETLLAVYELEVLLYDYILTRDVFIRVQLPTIVIRKDQFYDTPSAPALNQIGNAWEQAPLSGAGWNMAWASEGWYAGGTFSAGAMHHENGHSLGAFHLAYMADTMGGNKPNHGPVSVERVHQRRNELIDAGKFTSGDKYPFPMHPHTHVDVARISQNNSLEIDVLANDWDSNGDNLKIYSFTAETESGGTVSLLENGNLQYNPATDFIGKDIIVYTVEDDSPMKLRTRDMVHIEIVNNDLMVHYTYEETTGTKITDQSGNGIDGNLNGANFENYSVPGPIGKGIRVNGTQNENQIENANWSGVLVGDGDVMPVELSSNRHRSPFEEEFNRHSGYADIMNGDYTFATWFRFDDYDSRNWNSWGHYIASKWWHMESRVGWDLQAIDSKLTLHWRIFDGATSIQTLESKVELEEGAWYHTAAVFDRTKNEARIYLNGVLVGTKTNAFKSHGYIFNGRAPLALGGFSSKMGYLDDTRIYTKTLTDSEIRQLYEMPGNQTKFFNNSYEENIEINVPYRVNLESLLWNNGDYNMLFSSNNLPEWLTLTDDGILMGVPTKENLGDFVFNINAVNNQGLSTSAEMKFSVKYSGLDLDYWYGLTGTSVSDLTESDKFLNNPDKSTFISQFDIPQNSGSNYGVRVKGLLVPEKSGIYTFRISSDDEGELWLSSDENESNKVEIASVPGYSSYKQFNKYSEQTSSGIQLEADKKYFIEGLLKEGSGGDHLTVVWSTEGIEEEVIPNNVLERLNPENATLPESTVYFKNDFLSNLGTTIYDDLFQGDIQGFAESDEKLDLVYTKIEGPEWLKVGKRGRLSGIPKRKDIGVNEFKIQVSDTYGAKDETVITIKVSDHLIFHWDFNDTNSVDLTDITGNNNNGSVVKGTTTYVQGKIDGGFDFNDDGALARLENTVKLPDTWTIAALLYRRETGSTASLIRAENNEWHLKIEQYPNTNKVGITKKGAWDKTFNYSLPINEWTHLVFTQRKDGKVYLYADNIYIGSLEASMSLEIKDIGKNFNGVLDDLQVYGKDLTENEIAQLFNNNKLDEDTVPPKITLIGQENITIQVGETYTDQGATAVDDFDGNITSKIITTNLVDTNKLGDYTVTYNVTDMAGNNAVEVFRTVSVIDTTAPVITLIGSETITIDSGSEYVDQGALASDNYDGDLTANITIINTVSTQVAATFDVTYNVSDSSGNSALEVARKVIVTGNVAPIVNDVSASTDEDTEIQFNLSGTDDNDDELIYTISTPENGAASIDGSLVTYIPNEHFHGTDSFLYSASDGQVDSALSTVTITINPVNDTPIANAPEAYINIEKGASKQLILTGSDVDGDDLIFKIVEEPQEGTVTLENSILVYTNSSTEGGSDQIKFVVNDGFLDSEAAVIDFVIIDSETTPVVTDLSSTTNEETSVEITLLGSDADGDSLTYYTSEPNHGAISLNGNIATYTPDTDFNGSDSFTYYASDGMLDSELAIVTLTVAAINDAPNASNLDVTTLEDTIVEISLLGEDVDGDELIYITTDPENGNIEIINEAVTYTPNRDFNGTDRFTYSVSDGVLSSEIATVEITISPVNDAPLVDDLIAEVQSNASIELALESNDIDSEDFSFEVVDEPTHGTVTIEGNILVYQNASYTQTTDQFTYKANDGILDSEMAVITISITPHPEITATATIVQSACGALEGSISPVIENTVGATTYGWIGPDDYVATSKNISNLNPGNYTLEIIDEIITKTFTFEVPEKPIYQDLEICYVTTDQDTNHNIIVLKYPGIYNDQSYEILREGSVAGNYELIGEIVSGETSFLDTSSNSSSEIYSYKVRLKDNCGSLSEESSSHNTILLQSSVATDNSVNLNWTKYQGRSYGSHLIYRSVNGGEFEKLATISANNTSYNDTEADITLNGYAYYVAIEISSCQTSTLNTSSEKFNIGRPSISLETESISEIKSNRKQIANTSNSAPVVAPVSTSIDEDTSIEISLSGSDEEGDALSFSVTQPKHGTVTISGGTLTYVPDTDYYGKDTFMYKANDGALNSNAADIEITVLPVNDAPILSNIEPISVSEDVEEMTLITELYSTDIDSETISYTISGDSENNFTVEDNKILLNYSLDYERLNTIVISVTANDGELSDIKELVVNVEDVPNNSVEQEYIISVYDVVNEDNTQKIDYSKYTGPSGMKQSNGEGMITYDIIGGEDASLFVIDRYTGGLDFIEAPDYENPSDANGDNNYIVTVKITNAIDGAEEVPVTTNQNSFAVPEAQTAAADIDAINTTNQTDTDSDGVVDTEDNCPTSYNPGQEDQDGDGVGDVCDDSDMDTFFDAFDECPSSKLGATVDAKGCEVFALPSNTFSLSVTSATCPDSSNGSITISSSNTDYSYRYAIDDQAAVPLTDNTQTISNLSAGVYNICITVDGVSDYQRCYTIEITEPAPLVANSRVNLSTRSMQIDLSGATEYQVTLNGKTYLTKENNLNLNLEPGMNRVEVATGIDCQGVYVEEIFVSEEVKIYPNPTPGPTQVYVAGDDQEITLLVRGFSGAIIEVLDYKVPYNRVINVDLSSLPQGIYLIEIRGKSVRDTQKIIKE